MWRDQEEVKSPEKVAHFMDCLKSEDEDAAHGVHPSCDKLLLKRNCVIDGNECRLRSDALGVGRL